MPKVSVLIPIYNVAQYLDQALESVKRQTLQDIEIICVNDGSTDNSLEIIKKWAEGDDRFVIIDKKNEGYGVGMNVGVEKATGEYIGILEPDDYLPLDMYEDLYRLAEDNNLDFIKADFYKFVERDGGDLFLKYVPLDNSGLNYNKVLDPSMTPELTMMIQRTWPGLYKREFLEKYNIRHNTTPGAAYQDNGFFWQTSIYARRAMFVDKAYYRYRSDNPNASVKQRDKIYAHDKEYDFIRDIITSDKDPELWDRFRKYYYLSRFKKSCVSIKRSAEEFRREYSEYIYPIFAEALQNGDMDPELFIERDRRRFNLLMESAERFYDEYAVKAHTREVDDIVEKNKKQEKKIEKLNKKIAALKEENSRLESAMRRIKAGRSYRIAKKLTKAAGVIKK